MLAGIGVELGVELKCHVATCTCARMLSGMTSLYPIASINLEGFGVKGLWIGVCGLWFGVCGLGFVVCGSHHTIAAHASCDFAWGNSTNRDRSMSSILSCNFQNCKLSEFGWFVL